MNLKPSHAGLLVVFFLVSMLGLLYGSSIRTTTTGSYPESPVRTVPADLDDLVPGIELMEGEPSGEIELEETSITFPPRGFALPDEGVAITDEEGNPIPSTWCLTYKIDCVTTTTTGDADTSTTMLSTTTTIDSTTTTQEGSPPATRPPRPTTTSTTTTTTSTTTTTTTAPTTTTTTQPPTTTIPIPTTTTIPESETTDPPEGT